jgi:hypothetical protein
MMRGRLVVLMCKFQYSMLARDKLSSDESTTSLLYTQSPRRDSAAETRSQYDGF